MSRRRSLLRNASEYGLARSALVAARWMPRALLGPTSRLFGWILHTVIPSRRRVVAENLALAFGDAAPDARRIGRAALSGLCLSFMEMSRTARDPAVMRARARFRDPQAWDTLREIRRDGPVVVAATHFGAYEAMGQLASAYGVPTTTLARPLDNPWLEGWLQSRRETFGQRIVDNRGGVRDMVRALEDGSDVAIMVDLNHRPKRRVFVDFFGVPAATAPTAAILAIRSGRPIVSLTARRDAPLRYEIEVGPPHWPDLNADRDAEIQRLMQDVTTELETRVRAEPELWLWTHRRWKTRPDA